MVITTPKQIFVRINLSAYKKGNQGENSPDFKQIVS